MTHFPPFSRRRFLASGAALTGAAGISGFGGVHAQAEAKLSLRAVRRSIAVNGKPASVFGLLGPDGRPGLFLEPGQRFALDLANQAGAPTIVHWHGQTPSPDQDGVTDTGYAQPIAAGGQQAYDFAPRAGTHWMHSHHGLQEQQLMAAPLIVRSDADRRRDAQEVTILLHDFSFRDPAEILAGLNNGAGMTMDHGAMDHGAMDHGGMNMPGIDMSQMNQTMNQSGGAMAGMADINDVAYDAFLANDRTLGDPDVIGVERGGRVHLRVINGATATGFWLDLGALEGQVIAADGNPVQPVAGRRFPMAQGQRLDILIELPGDGVFPILAQREDDRARTGILLATPGAAITKLGDAAEQAAPPIDNALENRLAAVTPLAAKPADVTYQLALTGSMTPYLWSIDGRSWQDHVPLRAKAGQRIAIELINRSMMAHPMHLHGHHFQVVALDGRSFTGAVRDTVLVPVGGSATIVLDANNPGRWLFHCHNLYHMATGMMTELVYSA